ncbi:MAG: carbamoyl-phosphate synthase (glutamine-hydrolyzing) large subunit [Candidatus Levybacteria bacterium]|nr:carbamoyl-phosphate synthase (glutamine-hydrolyzing) large subunit [Candidatus Levybacteria bacterium]
MNKANIKKVLILGSGALKIGEAGEFDYSGSQAIKALKEEGIKTVLVNPNIATIQTSDYLADKVYFLPVSPFFVEKIIKKEKPDGILISFGGQTALNCGLKLNKKGILRKNKVKILGSPISAVDISEDRKKFVEHLKKINVFTPPSQAATSIKEAIKIASKIKYPVMVRAGFALGGQSSGIANSQKELERILEKAFSFVPQVLIEKYLHHYKEVEYEVVRDSADNAVTVCNMENMDPLGIHTGESVVIAPSQTLTNNEYHKLRSVSIKIVRSLGIVGECNVQFALNPRPKNGQLEYYVIELNARLSRSSALASKATGYPLAYVAAKLALGMNLVELTNKVTKATQFCFEPALDYVTIKIPRWDINKFKNADPRIGSSMKSVGEVMGIGRTFGEAYQKAIRMLDLDFEGVVNDEMFADFSNGRLTEALEKPTPERIFAISESFKRNSAVNKVYKLTGIDPWFLYRIRNITNHEDKIRKNKKLIFDKSELLELKQLGFSDKRIGELTDKLGLEIRRIRKKFGIIPSVFQIDTLAGEFPAQTNYLYLTYNASHNDIKPSAKLGVVVLGSGPYRIGSSVEFDWTSVAAIKALKKHKKKTIVINCNPETVSTDYDISDKLYFEELTFERIADILEFEKPLGTVVSVGGQTPNNRAKELKAYGFNILGTDPKNIDQAEDRGKFSSLLDKLNIKQPPWNNFTNVSDALNFVKKVGFPVLVRPSFVLSGSNMRIIHSNEELVSFLEKISVISKEYPVTISKFIEDAKEIEIDAVAQNGKIKVFAVSEHVENAGVHSGDASIVFPPQKIYIETLRKLRAVSEGLAKNLLITGPFNIQCLAKDNDISVIEINLRSSRTFPFISKVTRINFMDVAIDSFFGKCKDEKIIGHMDYPYVATKVAQFSFARLAGADPVLDVEMTSTGEVACFGQDLEEAFLKAELSVGGKIPKKGVFVTLGGDENKIKFLDSIPYLLKLGIPIYATEKTANFLNQNGITVKRIYKIYEGKNPNILDYFQKGFIDLAINISDIYLAKHLSDDYLMRRGAVDHNIPLFTNLKKAELFIKTIATKRIEDLPIRSWDEYVI